MFTNNATAKIRNGVFSDLINGSCYLSSGVLRNAEKTQIFGTNGNTKADGLNGCNRQAATGSRSFRSRVRDSSGDIGRKALDSPRLFSVVSTAGRTREKAKRPLYGHATETVVYS